MKVFVMQKTNIIAALAAIILSACTTGNGPAEFPQSKLVGSDGKGRLVYRSYTDRGDILADFSHCGYGGGGVAIPWVEEVAVLAKPTGGDDTPAIQALIDSVASLPLDRKGFRGAILLKAGTYRISEPLVIHSDGIVLRGEGADPETGTVLLATSRRKYNVIELGIGGSLRAVEGTSRQITDDYVPSGSRIINVDGAGSLFAAGDRVVVHRPSTAEWIRAIEMDSIPPRPLQGENTWDSFERLRRDGAATNMNGTRQWEEGTKDLLFERTVESVSGDRITLDIPIVNALQKEYGGATVYKYEFPGRISNCGVEHIYGMSVFDPAVTQENKYIGEHYTDENHANNFISCRAVDNAWVRNVSVEHFDCCVSTSKASKFITGQDLSAVDPVSVITGGRRYAYSVSGQMNLFQRCSSSHHRHTYVLGASVAGPNAFVDGESVMNFASSEPHQRWAAGCLFDRITITGPQGSLLAVDRGWFGSGHGWAGAQMVFWNCAAPLIMVMQPPTAQNFAIGFTGIDDPYEESSRTSTLRSINNVSRSGFEYSGSAIIGDGWIECDTMEVYPRSLYYHQLKDRLGMEAVRAVMTSSQIKELL